VPVNVRNIAAMLWGLEGVSEGGLPVNREQDPIEIPSDDLGNAV
jgi:hypothetical protein